MAALILISRSAFSICLLFMLIIGLPRAVKGEGENSDLELIPGELLSEPTLSAPQTKSEASGGPRSYQVKVFLDETPQWNFLRGSIPVPLPSSEFSRWNNRLSLDVLAKAAFSPRYSFTLSDRLNYISEDGEDLSTDSKDLQNDLKEMYLTWNAYESSYIDLGRVNIKNGVATGFNPTDYFKKNAVATRISEDASILRENRLGALMVRAQGIWEKGALSLVLSPEAPHAQDRWWTNDSGGGLELQRTNNDTRWLAKVNVNAFEDWNPELLYFNENGQSFCGLNFTRGIGDSIVAYIEYSIGQRPDVITESLDEARQSGAVPSDAPEVIPASSEIRFRNQLAVGFSYTDKSKRTTHFEYAYNEAGFSPDDWDNWFRTGAAAKSLLDDPATEDFGRGVLGELWAIRKFAQEAGEPLSRHSLFIRSFWESAFLKKLDLYGIFQINLEDGSFFLQPGAEYRLGDRLSINLVFEFFLGSDESEFGSLPRAGDMRLGFRYFF